MAVADLSGFLYFMPIFSFLFVFVVVYSILAKTKILGGDKFINLLVSFIISIVFSTAAGVRKYVQTVVPWVAVLIICLFFILLIIGLSQKEIDKFMKPGFVWVFVVILIAIFLISAFNVFSATMVPFWNKVGSAITTKERVYGSLLLIVITAIVSWVLAKTK